MSGFKILGIALTICMVVPSALMAVDLRLTENGNFREIFDSGLRPTMLGGRSNKSCYAKNVEITLAIAGHVFPEVIAKRIDIDVLGNHLMDEVVVFVGDKMSVDEARDLAIKWGVDESDLGEINLENFGWALVPKNDKWRANAGFVSSYNEDKPLLFRIFISWKRPIRELETNQGLLPPPPGYEHVSMEEEITDAQKASDSNAPPSQSIASSRPEKFRPTNSRELANASPERPARFPTWLVASSIILLAIAFVTWQKFRKSKPNH